MKSVGWLAAALLLAACGGATAQRPSSALPATFPSGDVQLAFALDLPSGAPPFPAVVLGHGSGLITRGHNTWLSAQLTRLGFAVLRFDKRGVGESTGIYTNVGVGNSEQ